MNTIPCVLFFVSRVFLMNVEFLLRIKKLAARIRTISVVAQEGKIKELDESDLIELLEIQQENALDIEKIISSHLNR